MEEEHDLKVEVSEHAKFLLRSSYYKHVTHERIASFQRMLLRCCRGHSLDELPDIVREALFWEADCDRDKDCKYILENNVITAVSPQQALALDMFGDEDSFEIVTGTGPILRSVHESTDLVEGLKNMRAYLAEQDDYDLL